MGRAESKAPIFAHRLGDSSGVHFPTPLLAQLDGFSVSVLTIADNSFGSPPGEGQEPLPQKSHLPDHPSTYIIARCEVCGKSEQPHLLLELLPGKLDSSRIGF